MKLFLTKYYLLTKKNLDNLEEITPSSLNEQLAENDVPSIFMAQPIRNRLSTEQIEAIKKVREQLFQEHDYQSDGMAAWQKGFETKYGTLNELLSGFGWVTVVQDQVVVRAQGDIWVWRVRKDAELKEEKVVCFKNHDKLEQILPNDIWLLASADEKIQPDAAEAGEVILNYAEKLHENETVKDAFHFLKIERPIDTQVQTTLPTGNTEVGQRFLEIAKRLIRANHPFEMYEPLLKSLSAHTIVGKEAKDLWTKYAPVVPPKPPVVEPEPPVVPPKPPVIPPKPPVVPPKPPTVEPKETTLELTEPSTPKLKPYMIGGAIVLAVIGASNLYEMRTPQSPREPQIIVPPKDSAKIQPSLSPVPTQPSPQKPDSLKREIPSVPQPSPTTPPSNQPPIAPMPKPITPTLPPIKTEAQTHLEKAMDLFNDAKLSIEKNPSNLHKALQELSFAKQKGLDEETHSQKTGEINDFKNKVLDKLQKEAANLSQSAETIGRKGEAEKDMGMMNNAVKIFESAQKKLELEHKIQPSDNLKERLKTIKEKIDFFGDNY